MFAAVVIADADTGYGGLLNVHHTVRGYEEAGVTAIPQPMMANMSNGGLTPMRTAAELADIGYALAIFPAMTSVIAAAAMEAALRRLKNDGEGHPSEMPIFDFKEFCGLIGFQDVWDFERNWAR